MDDAFRIKIGDVFQLHTKEVILACNHCGKEFDYFTEFSLHVQNHLEQLWQRNKVEIVLDEIEEHDRPPNGVIPIDTNGKTTGTNSANETTLIWIKTEESNDAGSNDAFDLIDDVNYSQEESIEPETIEQMPAVKTEFISDNVMERHQQPIASTSSGNHDNRIDKKQTSTPKDRHALAKRIPSAHPPGGYCDLCDKQFIRRTNYKQHMQLKHPNVKLKRIDAPTDYRIIPVQLQRTISAWQCYVCHREFAQNEGLRFHMRIFHIQLPVLCSICGKQQKTKAYLRRHMQMHNSNRSHACNVCDKAYTTRHCLLSHRKKKHNLYEGGKCKICSKDFERRSELIEHNKSHTTLEKQLECSMCNFVTTVGTRLKAHVATHDAERSFECPVCHKRYRQVSARDHMRIHSDEKSFTCTVCDMRFRTRQALRLHSIKHDKTNCRMYKCDVCDMAYPYKQYMLKHRRTHTETMAFHCKYCKLGFLTAETVRKHEMKHIRNELDK